MIFDAGNVLRINFCFGEKQQTNKQTRMQTGAKRPVKTMWIKKFASISARQLIGAIAVAGSWLGEMGNLPEAARIFPPKVATTLEQYKAEGGLVAVSKKKSSYKKAASDRIIFEITIPLCHLLFAIYNSTTRRQSST
ncbi:hypothetical protein T11_9521 [Trichinella zimbabwensis]|uniref:Uncharacterized protein n=1 Tax=Trichinella zimbabwensis TaxID=268475 RepID=A0A0V1HEA0_9BILA|nr:hypothetical protein T11_9521 [Trichinella zimbabwensis]